VEAEESRVVKKRAELNTEPFHIAARLTCEPSKPAHASPSTDPAERNEGFSIASAAVAACAADPAAKGASLIGSPSPVSHVIMLESFSMVRIFSLLTFCLHGQATRCLPMSMLLPVNITKHT